MQIGIIGLGKMGYNIALNLAEKGHEVIAFDQSLEILAKIYGENGISPVMSANALCEKFASRKIIWLMVPAGKPVDDLISELAPMLRAGDVLIDGGNSNYKDSIRRAAELLEKNIHFLDCGTSGGQSGARHGACTMIGGEAEIYQHCKPIFDAISLPGGSMFLGKSGAGHFAKMVHNGIEYGMMQAIAEGFEVLEKSPYGFDFQQVAQLWQQGSVVRSWLMELTANAFSKDPKLEKLRGIAHASGEGKWTVETALELGVPTPVIALSLMMRQRSQQSDSFSAKLVAALRNEFGGHAVEKV